MIRVFFFLLCPLLLFAHEQELTYDSKIEKEPPYVSLGLSANRKYFKEKDEIQNRYRAQFSEILKQANSAEVLLLSFSLEKKISKGRENEYLFISPYNSYSKILEKKKLNKESFSQCRSKTIKLLQSPQLAEPLCHFPIHGIRFFHNEELIFETSLCWHCSNYFFWYPDDFHEASWVGFKGDSLETFLKKELPIPQSEIDRFEAKYGTNSSKASGQSQQSNQTIE